MEIQDFLKLFGKKVKSIRTFHCISQEELGKVLGLSQPSISEIEAGNREMGVYTLRVFCLFFDYPPMMMLRKEELRIGGDSHFVGS